MVELFVDFGFDFIYVRIGSVFILRDNGFEAIAMIRGIGESVDSTIAVVVFFEGCFFCLD